MSHEQRQANKIFISYSHRNRDTLERLRVHLKPLERDDLIDPWDDTRLKTGQLWKDEIKNALATAKVAVLLVSADFLASDFIATEELPPLLAAERARGLIIMPVIVGPCRYTETPGLAQFMSVNDPARPISKMRKPDREAIWVKLAKDIEEAIGRPVSRTDSATTPLRVVILDRRNLQTDEPPLRLLEAELSGRGHQVFADRALKIGTDLTRWAEEIKARVRQADVVIPLLSADSVQNEMLTWEIHQAYDEARQRGLPRLLPVRVNYAKPLPQELGAILDRLQYHFLWIGPQDDERLVADLVQVLHGTRPMVPPPPIAFPVGGLPLDAQSYVQRRSDPIFHAAIARRDSIVLVRGARQMGKTSLLARGLQRAEEGGARVAFTDFQRLNQSELESLETFYKALGAGLAEALELDVLPEEVWKPTLPPNTNFQAYVRDRVLAASDAPLVWALDEVDRLFTCPFRTEVFALFRSWHNARTMPPAKFADLWKRLTLCIAYATEAHLFINNLDQSPFNVGTTITLEDFTLEQVADLNVRYHSPLRDDAELRAFFDLVGGHPYLVNRGLFEMAEHGLDPAAFRAQAEREEGLFGDHLRRIARAAGPGPGAARGGAGILGGKPCHSFRNFYRLRAAGVMAGESPQDVHPRCPLYATYLRKQLGIK